MHKHAHVHYIQHMDRCKSDRELVSTGACQICLGCQGHLKLLTLSVQFRGLLASAQQASWNAHAACGHAIQTPTNWASRAATIRDAGPHMPRTSRARAVITATKQRWKARTSQAWPMYSVCIYTLMYALNCRVASPNVREHALLGAPAHASQAEAVRASLERAISRTPVPLHVRTSRCPNLRHWLA